MSLPTLDEIKSYLRIEHDAEDDLVVQLTAQAIGAIESDLDRPIAPDGYFDEPSMPVAITMLIRDPRSPRRAGLDRDARRAVTQIRIPNTPVDLQATTPTLYDCNGDQVDETTYTIDDAWSGIIRGNVGTCFEFFPYTVLACVGLVYAPEYASRIDAAIGGVIMDEVADRYQQRNPNATTNTEGGLATSYGAVGISPRASRTLQRYRRVTL